MLTKESIIEAIIERRVKMGLTQQELADRSGISRTHISNIEKGRFSPTFESLINILNALNLKVKIS